MSLQTKRILGMPTSTDKSLDGLVIDLPEVGDRLPMHEHTANDAHWTVHTKGKIRWHGPTIPTRICVPGDVIDWREGVPHEAVAIEAPAQMVQITKR